MIRCGTGLGIRTEFIVYIINATYHTTDIPEQSTMHQLPSIIYLVPVRGIHLYQMQTLNLHFRLFT